MPVTGLEPVTHGVKCSQILLRVHLIMTPAGFEPAHPKINELKSFALDHSAIVSLFVSDKYFDEFKRSLNIAVTYLKKPPTGLEPVTLRLRGVCSTD